MTQHEFIFKLSIHPTSCACLFLSSSRPCWRKIIPASHDIVARIARCPAGLPRSNRPCSYTHVDLYFEVPNQRSKNKVYIGGFVDKELNARIVRLTKSSGMERNKFGLVEQLIREAINRRQRKASVAATASDENLSKWRRRSNQLVRPVLPVRR